MEPAIILAIVEAAASFGTALLKRWKRSDPQDPVQAEGIRTAVKSHYDDLQAGVTVRLAKILKFLRDSDIEPRVLPIRRFVYSDLQLDVEEARRFDNEFKYRLEYLTAIGLIRRMGASEYALTNLGAAFLEEAKSRGDYAAAML